MVEIESVLLTASACNSMTLEYQQEVQCATGKGAWQNSRWQFHICSFTETQQIMSSHDKNGPQLSSA